MRSLKQIREELKSIRYYYSRKKEMDEAGKSIPQVKFTEMLQEYNAAIGNATPKLYDVYISVYVGNRSIEQFAEEANWSASYAEQLNIMLVKFLQTQLD